jgi:hypothetical protein
MALPSKNKLARPEDSVVFNDTTPSGIANTNSVVPGMVPEQQVNPAVPAVLGTTLATPAASAITPVAPLPPSDVNALATPSNGSASIGNLASSTPSANYGKPGFEYDTASKQWKKPVGTVTKGKTISSTTY